MKPSEEMINQEINRLIEIAPKVRQFSLFGDDNRAAIEAEIVVLQKRMNEDQIYRKWEDENNYEHNRYLIDTALGAAWWLDGDPDYEAPSKGWEGLIVDA
jgi:hypothetical protein